MSVELIERDLLLESPAGLPLGLASSRDILGRIGSLETRIARSEHEMAVLMRSVQELIFRTDSNGRLTFVNARWEQLTGQPSAEAVGQPLESIVDGPYLAQIKALLDLGANDVIAEEFEASLVVFARVLAKFMVPRDDIERICGFRSKKL